MEMLCVPRPCSSERCLQNALWVGKSNSEAFEVINTRFNESLQEIKNLTEAKK